MSGQYKFSRVETAPDRDLLLATKLGSGVRVWNNVDKLLHIGDGETVGGTPLGRPITSFKYPASGSVSQPIEVVLRDIGISPRRFGAVGDAMADDTAAVQKASDACLALNPPAPLRMDGYFRTTAPIIINRPVNGALSNYEIIGEGREAGIFREGGGAIFDTTIAFDGVTPVSGELVFRNLNFVAPDAASGTVTVASGKFINVAWENCVWVRVRLVNAATYIQGFRTSDNCRALSWNGVWCSSYGAYDCHFDGLRTKFGGIDNGAVFSWKRNSNQPVFRCSITNGAFEGTGTVLRATNSVELLFAQNYCEYNYAPTLDFTGSANALISVCHNTFQPSTTQIDDPSFYDIKWGNTLRAESRGNYCGGRLHDTTDMTGANLLTINSDVAGTELFKGFKNNMLSPSFAGVGNVDLSDATYGDIKFRGSFWTSSKPGIPVAGVAQSSSANVGGSLVPLRHVFGPTNPQTDNSPYASAAWAVDSYVTNISKASGQPRGWRCTASGAPGVWAADSAYS